MDQIREPLADGIAETVEPAAEGSVFREVALKFSRDDDRALSGVRFEREVGG